ncbi:Excreted virulence factor EspC, type VII ESX diderm OS=Tsukamurella paurometabola (strain ATCC 8368/ DSM / CCUG 35730 / CIP 100753 / JCM 10117 / KCTC 9821/ NBRC 16120 / NCIMB 702349 / NCTC 13040) OX=521096 GN=Tpau_0873 PE=4 SV=1 [Tsukamurella paurometabola]|uniref:Excreted virulence factor EspC, type VII ESX diderm n=2 Tax=Tsukamurella paurometabola TaxID=2061 RepID=D5UUD6_TSUPD|nr:conserved hypothetical protein [Tsukamurella paurometabola DSM 20162]SUP27478.1 Uncharacterised protein [Tsukamurella paurometabola]
MGDRMAGTEIATAAVGSAGTKFSTQATTLGNGAQRIRGHAATEGDFGQGYADDGAAYAGSMSTLARAVEAWRAGSATIGTGLTTSASAHRSTDDKGATDVTGAGRG